ncbi:hypothetical protein V6N13_098776 [Hibiscus sabdariffa]|uniref:Uncharacterized protein n=1 Tax=Hibiscus sabdariffa TaxID=183260 RepID=A0ABR2EF91_9ROSI
MQIFSISYRQALMLAWFMILPFDLHCKIWLSQHRNLYGLFVAYFRVVLMSHACVCPVLNFFYFLLHMLLFPGK